MKYFLAILFVCVLNNSYSQTITELETELSFYKSGEEWGEKIDIAKKLISIDKFNLKAHNYLIEVYSRNGQKDSITVHFNNLLKNNPNSVEPYLLKIRGRNSHFTGLSKSEQIILLKKAQSIDSINTEILYLLGNINYELFLEGIKEKKNAITLTNYSNHAIQYFSELCLIQGDMKAILKYPLIQLSNYIKDPTKILEFNNFKGQTSYFPINKLCSFPDNWQTDYSFNVMWEVQSATFSLNWYSKHLLAFNEPVLSKTLPSKIFRFIWLRTFNNPIVISLINTNDSIILTWKVNDGAGGYDPGKTILNKSKELSIEEWNNFKKKVISINYWKLPSTENEMLGTDGARWILEGKELGKYQVVDRWSGGEIESICLELLKLTKLKIKKEDIY